MDQTSHNAIIEAPWETGEFLNLVMQAAANGLAVVDADGRIPYVNRTMAEMFGYPAEEMTDLPVEHIIPERFRSQHVEYRRGFMADPVRRAMGAGRDLFGLRKNGSEFPVEIGLSPLHVRDCLYVLASVIDITERKHAEKIAAIHTRRMEALNEQLASYTSAISHDLRAPFRAIRNYVDFLIEDLGGEVDPQSRQYLDALHTAVREADHMILDLLKLGRIGTGETPAAAVDFDELFTEIRRQLALGEDVELVTPSDWPDIEAPRVLLVHIFQNLVANAVKFNVSSPKRVEIAWRRNTDGDIVFYVKDNGIGIDPRYHGRIFDPFERLHAVEEYEGTGMGLSLVKKALAVLGGSIRVESELGRGSTFFVTLPEKGIANE
ncbi:MAG: PAS domain S-box protein [Phycisphaerae bacterium]|nr:PAS domain S-box protein [Phycisphaerae bacterium]